MSASVNIALSRSLSPSFCFYITHIHMRKWAYLSHTRNGNNVTACSKACTLGTIIIILRSVLSLAGTIIVIIVRY